jgi:hypothetical protein
MRSHVRESSQQPCASTARTACATCAETVQRQEEQLRRHFFCARERISGPRGLRRWPANRTGSVSRAASSAVAPFCELGYVVASNRHGSSGARLAAKRQSCCRQMRHALHVVVADGLLQGSLSRLCASKHVLRVCDAGGAMLALPVKSELNRVQSKMQTSRTRGSGFAGGCMCSCARGWAEIMLPVESSEWSVFRAWQLVPTLRGKR